MLVTPERSGWHFSMDMLNSTIMHIQRIRRLNPLELKSSSSSWLPALFKMNSKPHVVPADEDNCALLAVCGLQLPVADTRQKRSPQTISTKIHIKALSGLLYILFFFKVNDLQKIKKVWADFRQRLFCHSQKNSIPVRASRSLPKSDEFSCSIR